MKFFKKRETIVENISFFAIMAAINIVFVLLSGVLPPLMFLLVFILPATSTVVTLLCWKKYYIVYCLVTIGLCLLCSFGIYMYDTFFYVIPSLITGFIFGIMIEKQMPAIHILTLTTILQYILIFLTFIILDKILPSFDFFDRLYNMFGLQDFAYKSEFFHIFSFLIAAIQNLFTYGLIYFCLKNLNYNFNLENDKYIYSNIFSILASLLAIVGYFWCNQLLFIAIFVSLYYFVFQLINLIMTKKKVIIGLIIGLFVCMLFCYPLLYSYPKKPLSAVLFLILIVPLNILDLCNNTLLKRQG